MNNPKGKLIVIGGSVDRGSFSESKEDLKRNLRFFEKGILKRITTESLNKNLSKIEIITTASTIPEEVGEEYINAFAQLDVMNVSVLNIKTREEANAPENIERLKAADVETLGDLASYNKNDLLKFRNFGKKSLTELEELVISKGLSFGMNVAKYLDKE